MDDYEDDDNVSPCIISLIFSPPSVHIPLTL